jgi:hypothetical protein
MATSQDANPSAQPHLRIYCICGQKMKVSATMYGLPGKCIACRQKIRVPRPEELPPETTELHLRDHPEFLRKVPRPARTDDVITPVSDEGQDVLQDAGEELVAITALDDLEALQTLCSLEHTLRIQLSHDSGENDLVERQLMKVRHVRAVVDQELRQRLMEVAIEMANTNEKLAQTTLAARLGEIDYSAYQETVERYRRIRDRLERRQQNLRGWLTVADPYQAGGPIDVHIHAMPEPDDPVAIPPEPDITQPLLYFHIEALRDALFEREHAERRLHEAQRMRDDESLSAEELAELQAECKAQRRRAEALVVFSRDRLRQVMQDLRSDLQVAEAHLELARGRLQVGEIKRDRFDQVERLLRQSKADLSRGLALAQRAVNANAPTDVPHPRGSFLGRLAAAGRDRGREVDSYMLWVAAGLLAVSVFVPAWGDGSFLTAFWDAALTGTFWQWSMLGPLAAAGALIIFSAIDSRRLRGFVVLVAWLVATSVAVYALHEQQYTLGPIAAKLHETSGPWWIQPAFLLALLASGLTFAAGTVALLPYRERWLTLAAGALAVLWVALVVTDLAGWRRPDPHLQVTIPAAAGQDVQTVAVTITNHGGRPAYLSAAVPKIANGYLFAVEERLGPNSWRELYVPAPRTGSHTEHPTVFGVIPAGGGEEQIIFRLPPGEYRAKLRNWENEDIDVRPFMLRPPAGARRPPGPPPEEPLAGDGADIVIPLRAEAELKMFIAGPNRDPRFSFSLYYQDGREAKRDLSLGDELHEGWRLTEYNPNSQTVTLSDGSSILILERGRRTLLPVANREQPS